METETFVSCGGGETGLVVSAQKSDGARRDQVLEMEVGEGGDKKRASALLAAHSASTAALVSFPLLEGGEVGAEECTWRASADQSC